MGKLDNLKQYKESGAVSVTKILKIKTPLIVELIGKGFNAKEIYMRLSNEGLNCSYRIVAKIVKELSEARMAIILSMQIDGNTKKKPASKPKVKQTSVPIKSVPRPISSISNSPLSQVVEESQPVRIECEPLIEDIKECFDESRASVLPRAKGDSDLVQDGKPVYEQKSQPIVPIKPVIQEKPKEVWVAVKSKMFPDYVYKVSNSQGGEKRSINSLLSREAYSNPYDYEIHRAMEVLEFVDDEEKVRMQNDVIPEGLSSSCLNTTFYELLMVVCQPGFKGQLAVSIDEKRILSVQKDLINKLRRGLIRDWITYVKEEDAFYERQSAMKK